jgi:RNA polymerase sigma-70 factor (ECF subfamily)
MKVMDLVEPVRQQFDQLAHRLGTELMRYAFERCRNLDDAKDIVQRSLLKAWAVFREGARPQNPRAWLYRIVHNEAANHARDGRVRREAGAAGRLAGPAARPDRGLTADLAEVLEAVRTLPAAFKDSVVLHFMQGLTISETAQVLDVPLGTAKSQIARGLDLLRQRLGERTP